MTYEDLLQLITSSGFERIERDDRLHDVFLNERREKGIELWEKWSVDTVRILKVKLPYNEEKLVLYELFRKQLEHLLSNNMTAKLDDFERVAEAQEVRTLI